MPQFISSSQPRPDFASGQRVGVYGGSFDPIHAGHVATVLAAVKAADLDRVLYLPTAFPPHKQDRQQAPVEARLAMVRLAIEDHSGLLVGDDEISATETFTVNTLRNLSAEFEQVEFVLLMGADSYAELDQWRSWEDIVAGWDIVVLPRPGWPAESELASPKVKAALCSNPRRKHLVLEQPLHEVSSSEIRQLLGSGKPVPTGWLSPSVLSFIHKQGLYAQESLARHPPLLSAGSHAANLLSSDTSPAKTFLETVTISAADQTVEDSAPADSQSAGIQDSDSDRPEIAPLPREVAFAAATALDRQAVDLRLLQVTEICDFADYFLICSGNSDRQVGAIAHAIQRKLRSVGEKPLHIEGERRASWILLDYGHFIVHVFDPKTRDFYRLERLWSDAPRVPHQLFGSAEAEGYRDRPSEVSAIKDGAPKHRASKASASRDDDSEE